MPLHVCNGATLQCSFGSTPSALTVLPVSQVLTGNQPGATILDHKPVVNVAPFGLCSSLANPAVASATAAASGVLTPMPCLPATTAPWVPGSPTVTLGNAPALTDTSTLMCNWAGVISVLQAGQVSTQIP